MVDALSSRESGITVLEIIHTRRASANKVRQRTDYMNGERSENSTVSKKELNVNGIPRRHGI